MTRATESTIHVLSAGGRLDVPRQSDRPRDELWLRVRELQEVSGWQLRPEGLCKGGVCRPLGPGQEPRLEGDLVCASDLWQSLGRPVLHDRAGESWLLGEAAHDRSGVLESLVAPDFSLPDIDGVMHRLSDYRGKKVLLVTWASW